MTNRVIAFTKVRLPYGWLSNVSPYPIADLDGRIWPTVEHLFQAMRFAVDDPICERIRTQKSPMGAKMLARAELTRREVPEDRALDLRTMAFLLKLKISQHLDLWLWLVETGDALIVEDVTNRPGGSGLFWGAARSGNGWTGENHLGKLWMELRDRLHRHGELR